jgi:hypothetical protein
MESVEWEQSHWKIGAKYQIINDGYVYISGGMNDTEDYTSYKYYPEFMLGKQVQFETGICWGF